MVGREVHFCQISDTFYCGNCRIFFGKEMKEIRHVIYGEINLSLHPAWFADSRKFTRLFHGDFSLLSI